PASHSSQQDHKPSQGWVIPSQRAFPNSGTSVRLLSYSFANCRTSCHKLAALVPPPRGGRDSFPSSVGQTCTVCPTQLFSLQRGASIGPVTSRLSKPNERIAPRQNYERGVRVFIYS